MKKAFLTAVIFLQIAVLLAQTSDIPQANVKDLNGKIVNTSTFQNDGKPIIISFWATWCKPCIRELIAISDVYEDWQDETGVKLITISIDDAKSMARVKPFVNARGWEYESYIDANSKFKQAMGVVNVPHTFLIDGNGKIVFQHNSYAPGDEDELYEKIQELVK